MDYSWLEQDNSNLYGEVENVVNEATVSVYELLAKIGVYASGIAIMVAAAILIINAASGGEKLADAKRYVVRVLIVSILIFGVSGLVITVMNAGF